MKQFLVLTYFSFGFSMIEKKVYKKTLEMSSQAFN